MIHHDITFSPLFFPLDLWFVIKSDMQQYHPSNYIIYPIPLLSLQQQNTRHHTSQNRRRPNIHHLANRTVILGMRIRNLPLWHINPRIPRIHRAIPAIPLKASFAPRRRLPSQPIQAPANHRTRNASRPLLIQRGVPLRGAVPPVANDVVALRHGVARIER